MKYLKTLNPSHFDYELRSSLFGQMKKIDDIFSYFECFFNNADEFDLKLTYFHRFLSVN